MKHSHTQLVVTNENDSTNARKLNMNFQQLKTENSFRSGPWTEETGACSACFSRAEAGSKPVTSDNNRSHLLLGHNSFLFLFPDSRLIALDCV